MTIRQVKHKGCGQIVLLDIVPMNKTRPTDEQQVVVHPSLRCPIHGPLTMADVTPQGAVCVLFTQE